MSSEMKKGKIRIFTTDADSLKINSGRPSHWGKLVIPDGCKPGDTLKVADPEEIWLLGFSTLNLTV